MPYRAFAVVPYDRAGERPREVFERVRMKPLAEALARESGHRCSIKHAVAMFCTAKYGCL